MRTSSTNIVNTDWVCRYALKFSHRRDSTVHAGSGGRTYIHGFDMDSCRRNCTMSSTAPAIPCRLNRRAHGSVRTIKTDVGSTSIRLFLRCTTLSLRVTQAKPKANLSITTRVPNQRNHLLNASKASLRRFFVLFLTLLVQYRCSLTLALGCMTTTRRQ